MASSTWCWNSKPVLWRILKRRPELLNSMLHTSAYDCLPAVPKIAWFIHSFISNFRLNPQITINNNIPSIVKHLSSSYDYTMAFLTQIGILPLHKGRQIIPRGADLKCTNFIKGKQKAIVEQIWIYRLCLYIWEVMFMLLGLCTRDFWEESI